MARFKTFYLCSKSIPKAFLVGKITNRHCLGKKNTAKYTTWKVDGTTPMYWIVLVYHGCHGPLLIHLLGVAPSTFTTV